MSPENSDDTPTADERCSPRGRPTVDDPEVRDDVLSILTDRRRRLALRTLLGSTDAITVTELSREMRVAVERRDAGDSLPPAETLAVSLHHAHLPMMADVGIVSYDPGTRRAALAGESDECDARVGIERLLAVLDGRERRPAESASRDR